MCGAVIGLVGTTAARAVPQVYDFVINQSTSGIDATVTNTLNTAGTLIGDYDATTNPTGTRTKPGLFGSFGSTENVAVPVTLVGGLSGRSVSHTSGGFGLALDTATGGLSVTNFGANLLAGGRLRLPATVTLSYDTFRTRTPNSTYIGGFPVTLPFGEADVTALTMQQIGPGSVGTVTQTGVNTYDFTTTVLVQTTASFDLFGNTFDIPGAPSALLLQGQIVLNGEHATLSSLNTIDISNSQDINQVLPQFAFGLPTIIPPGSTANVLFDLNVNSISSSISGDNSINANGVLVPAPAACVLLLGAAGLRRRR
jgi:hypothetical protein